MNPYAITAAVLFWVGSVIGAGVWSYGAGQDEQIAKEKKTDDIVRQVAEAAQSGAAQAIAANKPRNTTIKQETEREIRENTVYRDCKLTDGVLLNINEALTGRRQPASSSSVPGTVTAQQQ